MKITEFTTGAIVHRTKSTENDSSYVTEPIVFVAVESGLIFYKYVDNLGLDKKKFYRMELVKFDDDNWDYFPEEYLGKE